MAQQFPTIPGDDRWEADVLFSLRDGFVWVTWPETEAAVKLGRHEMVAAMMRDFIAQDELGERLTRDTTDVRRPNP